MTGTTTFADTLVAALRCFEGAPGGRVSLRARDLFGWAIESQLQLEPPFRLVPMPLIALLTDDLSVRVSVFNTRPDLSPSSLPIVLARWHPQTDFEMQAGGGRHVVTKEGAARVRSRLAQMPPPSLLIDGGPETIAGWRLTAPVTDVRFARELLKRAAVCLNSTPFDEDGATDVPLAGPVRSWNSTNPDQIAIVVADPSRRYTLDQLERDLRNVTDQPAGTGTADQRRPRGRAAAR